ncbi:MAG: selenide, water dikinase SelD [Spirochaetota bacterium]
MAKKINLTEYTAFSGCGAKLGPGLLDQALCGLSQPDYPQLLADYSSSEDCGIYALDDTRALIHTIDFFPPIVDDPATFGRIAAANSLSDIYAMGGRPLTAVSVVCFPKDRLEVTYLRDMTAGALQALGEAGTALVGGHSVEDVELKFGFSVTGIIDISDIRYNNTIEPGDKLILTKPLGTGIINTALRAEMASEQAIHAAEDSMQRLNKEAAEIMQEYSVHACTDVTGFGLIGHACEMLIGSQAGIKLYAGSVKLLPEVTEYVSMGLIPAGTYRNKDFRSKWVHGAEHIDEDVLQVLYDPQTSGGLLISIGADEAHMLLNKLCTAGVEASIVGEVVSGNEEIHVV